MRQTKAELEQLATDIKADLQNIGGDITSLNGKIDTLEAKLSEAVPMGTLSAEDEQEIKSLFEDIRNTTSSIAARTPEAPAADEDVNGEADSTDPA